MSAISASGGPATRDQQRADGAGEERADGGDRERRPGAALPRHLVAVDAGHDRGGFARQVDQDGGGRAAVLGAVVDAGQHDQRADRRHAVGDRHQHRDGAERADAGQHADQRADRDADQAIEQVLQRERDAEAEDQIVEEIHASEACDQRIGQAERPDEHDRAERGQEHREQEHLDRAGIRCSRVAEPKISTNIAGTKPARSISTPNRTSDSGSTMSARSDQEPSIFSPAAQPGRQDVEAEQDQEPAEDGRKIARPHAQRRAERIVARDARRPRPRPRSGTGRPRSPCCQEWMVSPGAPQAVIPVIAKAASPESLVTALGIELRAAG